MRLRELNRDRSSDTRRTRLGVTVFVCLFTLAIGTTRARADEPASVTATTAAATPAPSKEGVRPVAPVAPAPPDTSAFERALAEKDDSESGWHWIEARYLFGFFAQQGHGLQSQSGEAYNTQAPITAAGSEKAFIVEPLALLKVRQSKHVTHEIYLPIDVVSAASPDALDVTTSASRTNVSIGFDATTTYSPSPIVDYAFKYGFRTEEPLRSFNAGPSLTLHLLEDNTIFNVSAYIIEDGFDPIQPSGFDAGFASRGTFNGNVSYTQVLSPTTLFDASFGGTEQWGVLQTTYNSVIDYHAPGSATAVSRRADLFPESRARAALFARIAQFIPSTSTTIKASYRFYFDETAVQAHTGEVQIYQYIVPWFFVHLLGRLHTQTAISFWVPYIREPFSDDQPRTSDSDLAALWSHEVGFNLVLDRTKAPRSFRATDSFDLGYLHYQRSDGLTDDYVSFGYAKKY